MVKEKQEEVVEVEYGTSERPWQAPSLWNRVCGAFGRQFGWDATSSAEHAPREQAGLLSRLLLTYVATRIGEIGEIAMEIVWRGRWR